MRWYWGSPIQEEESIGRSLSCPAYGTDLRSCRNRRFHLPGSPGDCGESRAETVHDTERSNFCGGFSLNPRFRSQAAGQAKAQNAAASAGSAFEKPFNG